VIVNHKLCNCYVTHYRFFCSW